MTGPRTEAGRALLEMTDGRGEDLVLAVEAEAASRPAAGDRQKMLDDIRDEVREAVLEGDAQDCSSADCIADAVYDIVRSALVRAAR